MIRTILTDDHKLFCEGLERVLHDSGNFEVIGKFHNGQVLLENIEALNPELLLLDIEIPGADGLDVLHRIRLKDTNVKIVMLSMHEDGVYSREAIAAQADGYLTKSIESGELIEKLLRIFSGEKLFHELKAVTKSERSLLSSQESKILKLIAQGKTSEQIAGELVISNLTVKAHRRNMMRKLGAENSAEMIRMAFGRGIL